MHRIDRFEPDSCRPGGKVVNGRRRPIAVRRRVILVVKQICRFLTATIIICSPELLNAQEAVEQYATDYPRGADALPLLNEVWNFSAENIYPTTLADRFDLRTLARLEELLRSSDNVALADVLNPFLESLGVSHTRFYDRRHQSYYVLRSLFSTRDLDEPKLYTIGVQLDDNDPGLVLAVLEDSPAAAHGVHRADRIIAVDDVPFKSLLQWQKADSIRLSIETKSGRRDVNLIPVRQSFHRSLARATVASEKVIDCRDQRIGYLHLWSGTHQVFLDALEDAVERAKGSDLDGFILDLRDGYGGAWWPYLDPFFSDRDSYFAATNFDSTGERDTLRPEPKGNPGSWDRPLAVLINGGTRSGKESLAFQFRKSGRAKLFGTTTNGAFTGGLGAFVERDVNYVLYLSVQETQLDRTALEGVGVSPDVVVPVEEGRDAPLSAALDHLGCQTDLM